MSTNIDIAGQVGLEGKLNFGGGGQGSSKKRLKIVQLQPENKNFIMFWLEKNLKPRGTFPQSSLSLGTTTTANIFYHAMNSK